MLWAPRDIPRSFTTGLFSTFLVRTAKLGLRINQSRYNGIGHESFLLQRVESILPKLYTWGKVANQKTDGASSQSVLKQAG